MRQAVAGYGLDRQEIVKLGFFGYGQPSVSMLTPGMPARRMERYPYDPAEGQGVAAGGGIWTGPSPHLHFSSPTIEPAFTNVPTLFKAQLERIGVQMKIEMLDKVTWMDRFVRQQDFQVTMGNVTGFTIGAFAPFRDDLSLNLARHRHESR